MKSQHLGRSVSIIGAAYTHMGVAEATPELKDFSEREMYANACIEAMQDGGVEAKDVDAYLVGHCGPNFYSASMCAAPHYADWIGMHNKPAIFHDEGCATSVYGVNQAVMMVASGMYDCVVAGAVGFNTTVPKPCRPPYLRKPLDNDTLWDGMYYSVEAAYDKPGNAGVGNAEATLLLYLKEHGYGFKDYDEAMVGYLQSQRWNALHNPKAHLFPTTLEEEAKEMQFDNVHDYLLNDIFNPRVGTILRGKYLGQSCDGASAVVVCASDIAEKYSKHPIRVTGIGEATNVIRDWGVLPNKAVESTIHGAMKMAGITGDDIDYMAVHDCTGGALFLDTEVAGYVKPGEGIKAAMEGRYGHDGDKPLNTSGGRLQLGHPAAGALGIEITEAVKQMRGENGDRQVKNQPDTTLVSCQGTGFSIATMVLQNK